MRKEFDKSTLERRRAICLPLAASQMRAVPSFVPVTTRRPSGLKPANRQNLGVPAELRSPTVQTSMMRALVSSRASEPTTIREPSGLNTALGSSREIPGTTKSCLPEATSHSKVGPAEFAVRTCVPTGLKTPCDMDLRHRAKTLFPFQLPRSQMRAVLSFDPVKRETRLC